MNLYTGSTQRMQLPEEPFLLHAWLAGWRIAHGLQVGDASFSLPGRYVTEPCWAGPLPIPRQGSHGNCCDSILMSARSWSGTRSGALSRLARSSEDNEKNESMQGQQNEWLSVDGHPRFWPSLPGRAGQYTMIAPCKDAIDGGSRSGARSRLAWSSKSDQQNPAGWPTAHEFSFIEFDGCPLSWEIVIFGM